MLKWYGCRLDVSKTGQHGIIYMEAAYVAASLVKSDLLGLKVLLGEIGMQVANRC